MLSDEAITLAHVLIVEDNPMAMNIAVLMLKKANFSTSQASNATQALRLAKTERFDFILSDIGLPDFSGFSLAKRIHEFEAQQGLPPTPIIGLTAHAKKDIQHKEDVAEMYEICEKPLRLEVLTPIVERLHQHKPEDTFLNITNTALNYKESPLFEESTFKKQLSNDKVMHNVLKYMLESELPETLTQINKAYTLQDWPYLAKIMHRFKSSCLYCATTRLLYITQELEKEIEVCTHQRKTELYQSFQQIAEETQNALHLKISKI